MVSLCLTAPLNPAELRGLPARAEGLIAAAESAASGRRRAAPEDRDSVREKLQLSARDWLGRTVAMFACADAGDRHRVPDVE